MENIKEKTIEKIEPLTLRLAVERDDYNKTKPNPQISSVQPDKGTSTGASGSSSTFRGSNSNNKK